MQKKSFSKEIASNVVFSCLQRCKYGLRHIHVLASGFCELKHENQDPSRFDFVCVYAAGVVTVDGP
jgi:hypothetical protein